MAGEEVPKAGAAEKIEIEDTISPVSEEQAPAPQPVIICDQCARGFLNWIPDGVDIDPLWFVFRSGMQGGICGGALRLVSRSQAMDIADCYEKIGSEQWLRGQRKPW